MTTTPRDFADIDLAVKKNLLKNAREEVERAKARLDETRTKHDALLAEVRAACPHANVTECPAFERHQEGPGFPPTKHGARRRCEDCGLQHNESQSGSALFALTPQRSLDWPLFDSPRPPTS